MRKFIDDDTRWVKEAAYLKLGQFLSTLTRDNMNDKLLADFIKLPKIAMKLNKDVRINILLECAIAYPKV